MSRKIKQFQRNRAISGQYLARARELFGLSDLHPGGERRALEDALSRAKRSLLLDPENYEVLILLGRICEAMDDPESVAQALCHYDRAIALHPDNADGYDAKAGLLMYYLNRPEEAERTARKALTAAKARHESPEFLELRYMTLIDILVAREKYPQARWLIRRALRDCPTEFMADMVEMPLKEIDAAPKAAK